MGYLFLALSIFAGLAKGFCGKKISSSVESYKDAMLTNFLRMIFCIIIGFGMVLASGGLTSLSVSFDTVMITLLSGVATSCFVIFWIICVRKGAYIMLEVFLMIGIILTTVLCKIFFDENIRPNQYIGFVFLIVAAYLMCSYNASLKGVFSAKSVLLLIACTVSCSLTDFSQKLFVYCAPNPDTAVFNFYTYVFSAVVLAASFVFCKSRDSVPVSKDLSFAKSLLGIILIMSVCLFANSFFKVLAAKELDSATLYPLSQGSALILSALMAAVFFKEKPNVKSIAGMITAFAGLLIINLL